MGKPTSIVSKKFHESVVATLEGKNKDLRSAANGLRDEYASLRKHISEVVNQFDDDFEPQEKWLSYVSSSIQMLLEQAGKADEALANYNKVVGGVIRMRNIHPSHETRLSDSSLYDERCVNCGAADGRNDDRLYDPCPAMTEPNKPDTSIELSIDDTLNELDSIEQGALRHSFHRIEEVAGSASGHISDLQTKLEEAEESNDRLRQQVGEEVCEKNLAIERAEKAEARLTEMSSWEEVRARTEREYRNGKNED